MISTSSSAIFTVSYRKKRRASVGRAAGSSPATVYRSQSQTGPLTRYTMSQSRPATASVSARRRLPVSWWGKCARRLIGSPGGGKGGSQSVVRVRRQGVVDPASALGRVDQAGFAQGLEVVGEQAG